MSLVQESNQENVVELKNVDRLYTFKFNNSLRKILTQFVAATDKEWTMTELINLSLILMIKGNEKKIREQLGPHGQELISEVLSSDQVERLQQLLGR